MMNGSRMQEPLLLQHQLNQQQQQRGRPLLQRTASGEVSEYKDSSGLIDQRDLVWPKLQVLKDIYLQDLEELYGLMTTYDSRALSAEHVLKLNHYMEILRRMITYLRVSRDRLPVHFTQQLLDSFSKQIVVIIEIFKRKPDRNRIHIDGNLSGGSLTTRHRQPERVTLDASPETCPPSTGHTSNI